MSYLENYLNLLHSEGSNTEQIEKIKNTVKNIVDQHVTTCNINDNQHKVGLLFGNVQSGKTARILGIICGVTDVTKFNIFIFLTSNLSLLQKQTFTRAKNKLKNHHILKEKDINFFKNYCNLDEAAKKPIVIVLKKNTIVLLNWLKAFQSLDQNKRKLLFIIDDEADNVSLNTQNAKKPSPTHEYLSEIKKCFNSVIYLQVTATPQALLLQEKNPDWKPSFIEYFDPGTSYLGGDFFFPIDNSKPKHVIFTDEKNQFLIDALIQHVIATIYLFLDCKKVCNFLIHTSYKKEEHQEIFVEIESTLSNIKKKIDTNNDVLLKDKIKKIYDDLDISIREKYSWEKIYSSFCEQIKKINIYVLNSDSDKNNQQYFLSGSNIIVSGNRAGRGVTFPGLQTVFYARSSDDPNADTMWQHNRIFGYDRNPKFVKLFITKNLYFLFVGINKMNNKLISQIKQSKNINNLHYQYDKSELTPCRSNLIYSSNKIARNKNLNHRIKTTKYRKNSKYLFNKKNIWQSRRINKKIGWVILPINLVVFIIFVIWLLYWKI